MWMTSSNAHPEGQFDCRRALAAWVSDQRSPCHITSMARTHPHAEATYRIVTLPKEGVLGVEVVIPESLPTTVTEFATEAEAAAWIARHKTQVVEDASSGSPFQKKRRNTHG